MDPIKILLILQSIRVKGDCPFPVSGNWGYLNSEINELIEEGLLEPKDGQCVITKTGKKTLLMFDSEIKDILSELEVYKEVMIENRLIDARLPICAFKVRKLKPEQSESHLRMVAIAVYWKDFFTALKGLTESVLWQKALFSAFDNSIIQLSDRFSWRRMGKTINEAILTCERLIKPKPITNLIQITKN